MLQRREERQLLSSAGANLQYKEPCAKLVLRKALKFWGAGSRLCYFKVTQEESLDIEGTDTSERLGAERLRKV